MRIGIRADANESVATGHVMRCLAIAEELKSLGQNPLFISADDFPRPLIEQRGFDFVSLQSDWKHMEKGIEQLQAVVDKYHIGLMLVDSYYVTKAYFEKIHSFTKAMYIDDLGKEVYDVDFAVCYANYYKELELEERYPSNVRLLLGTRYAPLRREFSDLPPKRISPEIKEVLVLSGGTDPYDFLLHFSQKLLESSLFETLETIRIICGRYYDKYDELTEKFAGTKKLHFHKAVKDIEKYMLSADVAVTAAGVTTYELCAAGVPAITYTIADNQQGNARVFQKEGIMEYAGDLRREPVIERITGLLDGKYRDFSYRSRVSEAMRQKIDGKGTERIARSICRILRG